MRIARPTHIFEITLFRLGTSDRPTRRAQRGEENFGSEHPTDRPALQAAQPSVPTRAARPTDPSPGTPTLPPGALHVLRVSSKNTSLPLCTLGKTHLGRGATICFDPPRAARRGKFWVGTPDRPTLLGPARAGRKPFFINYVAFRLLAGRTDRPTDPTPTDSGQSDLPTDRPTQRAFRHAKCTFNLPLPVHGAPAAVRRSRAGPP